MNTPAEVDDVDWYADRTKGVNNGLGLIDSILLAKPLDSTQDVTIRALARRERQKLHAWHEGFKQGSNSDPVLWSIYIDEQPDGYGCAPSQLIDPNDPFNPTFNLEKVVASMFDRAPMGISDPELKAQYMIGYMQGAVPDWRK